MFANKGRVLLALGLSGVLLSACSKPPAAEIEAADASMAASVAAGAEEYASASLGTVRDLRAQLDAELAIQSEKSFLTRSYGHAEELAAQIQTAAEEVSVEAARVKDETRTETTALLSEVKVALTEVQEMMRTAPRGKGSAADLAALQADLDSATATLAEGETALNEGRYMEAKAKVLAAQSGAQTVRSAIEAAIRGRVGG